MINPIFGNGTNEHVNWVYLQSVKIRGFQVAKGWEHYEVELPKRSTACSAGYDFFAIMDCIIQPNLGFFAPALVPTGVKCYMGQDEYLDLRNRSSNPKKGLLLANGAGVVDCDYYSNTDNDGHIQFAFWNVTNKPVTIKRGDKIGQGIFQKYLLADGDDAAGQRVGGFGSTDN